MSKKVQKFEDLIAWQKARKLTARIYKITNEGRFSGDFGLRDQLRRAAVSVMSNIAEGFERGSAADFHRFLVMSKASRAEVRNQLYVSTDIEYLPPDVFNSLMRDADEVARIIGGLRASIQRTRARLPASS